jgi:hypothetical protein
MYDSTKDTQDHIELVGNRIGEFCAEMVRRAAVHDQTKLGAIEKKAFDNETPKLRGLTYGSEEYKLAIERLGVALKHHYAKNSHHPEHYKNGVSGMDLYDLVEMLCDWLAACERHSDGDIFDSLDHNRNRFELSDQLYFVLQNTVSRWNGDSVPRTNTPLPADGRLA